MNGKIFFIHVPKTAGLTIRLIFAELLGFDRVIKLGAYGPGRFLTMAEFRALPPERLAASPVITGHFAWGCQNWADGPRQVGLALRDPCTRVLSYLDHQRRAAGDDRIVAAKLRADPECNNGMVRRLRGFGEFDERWWDFLRDSSADPMAALGPEDFDIACHNLAVADTVLLTEKFVEGCVLWRHRLGTPPLVSMQNQFRNHAPRPTECADWPADFVAEVRERNALDDALYAPAQARAAAELAAASPAERDEMIATRCLADALSRRGQSDISLADGIGLVLPLIDRLVAEGRPEVGVRVGCLLAERVPDLADPWTSLIALCRRTCPELEGEIEAARRRAAAWSRTHPRLGG